MLFFYVAFNVLYQEKQTYKFIEENEPVTEVTEENQSEAALLDDDDLEKKNLPLNCTNLMMLIPKTFYHIFNLFLVYYFEYVIITSFANVMDHKIKADNPTQEDETLVKHYFVILNVMY